MSQFASPFTGNDPWAQAASNAFQSLATGFSGQSQDERRLADATIALRKAQADRARAESEKAAAETLGLTGRNDAVSGLPGLFNRMMLAEQGIGSEAVGPTPMAAMPVDGAAYAPPAIPTPPPGATANQFRPELMGTASALAYDKPGDLGAVFRALYANSPGVSPADLTTVMMGAGSKYADTMPGFETAEANDLIERAMIEQGDLNEIGATPLTLSQTQGKLLGENFDVLEALNPYQQQAVDSYIAPHNVADGATAIDPKGNTVFENEKDFAPGSGPKHQAVQYLMDDGSTVSGSFADNGGYADANGNPMDMTNVQSVTRIGQPTGSNADLGLTTSTQGNVQDRIINLSVYKDMSNQYRKTLQESPSAAGTRGNIVRLADGLLGQVSDLAPDSAVAQGLDSVMQKLAGMKEDGTEQDAYAATTIANLLPYIAAGAIVGQSGRGLSDEDRRTVARAVGSPEQWTATPKKLISRLDTLDALVERLAAQYQGFATEGLRAAGNAAPQSDADFEAEYDALPSGATYTAPDGSVRTKP